MSERRRFNDREHVVLYLAADGHCVECGAELEPGWHGDHVRPFVAGGPTDVINGQALCPTCNLRKGSKILTDMRMWQRRATNAFYETTPKDFLVSATPGAGKTWFALGLAKRIVDERSAERVVVVVPTDALRQQWADAAAAVGLALMPVAGPDDYHKAGYAGCVVTYAQVARGVGSDLLRRSTRLSTVAILDEIHHAGENRSWGDGLAYALEHAVHRIALTGTPWRNDNASPIPFVAYDAGGKVKTDYAYEYGEAVADGVCRRIEFHAYDGEARWRDCGKVEEAKLGADLLDDDVSAVLDAVYQADNGWMPTLLAEAVTALDELRQEIPDAAGLVIAERQRYAYAYADLLEKLTGVRPAVVVSDDPDAKAAIDRFRAGRDKWIVAVRMVSEGVDIPRLGIGVYASKTRTPLFFRQVVGRFVRTRPGEEFNARLFIPAVPALMKHAREIEDELRHQLDIEIERDEKARSEAAGERQTFDLREPLSATEAVFDRAIFAGDEVTPAEIEEAAQWCRRNGIPTHYAANVARGRREEGRKVAEVTIVKAAPAEPRHRRERMLRGDVVSLANKLARRSGIEPRQVNADLLRAGFPARARATVEDLERMVAFLAARIGEL